MRIGFIGLGQVGGKLAASLARNGFELVVRDPAAEAEARLVALGARAAASTAEVAEGAEMVITCLPSPAISAAVAEGPGGLFENLAPGAIWAEMSTTDPGEMRRLAAAAEARGIRPIDCPVSGGCHRAATGNIAILAGAERATFEAALPALSAMGRDILHCGPVGTASELKVVTNYLATAHLLATAEALATVRARGIDLGLAYDAIRISSGNSFVHETEGQVILNGSRDIGFTMGLVAKDIGLFRKMAEEAGLKLELSPLLCEVFDDGIARWGPGEHSPNIIRRIEEAAGIEVLAPGFPAEIADDEPEVPGCEISARHAARAAE